MKYKILIDKQFPKRLYEKIGSAKKRIYCQFMTFEGDSAGLKLSRELIKAKKRGVDVKVIIDCFTDVFVSDTYYTREEVAEEVASTKKMIEEMKDSGIKIVRTRPYGFLKLFFLFRNHKKIIIIDDVFYLGGINISEHNLSWHDFMVEFKNKELLKGVLKDFNNSLKGIKKDTKIEKQIITNKYIKEKFDNFFKDAKREIIISSPYLIDPGFLKRVNSVKEGVKVKVLTLDKSNFFIVNFMSHHVYSQLKKRKNVETYFYSDFSHAKFMIVDRKEIFFGSSNFGRDSFLFKQEIAAIIDDKKFVKEFYDRLYLKKRRNLVKFGGEIKTINSLFSFLISHFTFFLAFIYRKLLGGFLDEVKKE